MIVVTFALEDESRDFVRKIHVAERLGRGVGSRVHGKLGDCTVLVWHVGVGRQSAHQEGSRLLAQVRGSAVICAGYGGALIPDLKIADVVVEWSTTQRPTSWIAGTKLREGRIVTIEKAAETAAQKEALGRETGAAAVDMETDVLRGLCTSAGVPFVSIRSISDRMEDSLPVPMEKWFNLRRQRPRPLALLCFLIGHPGRIRPFARFVRNLSPARRELAEKLEELIPALKC